MNVNHKGGRPKKNFSDMERLSLKIPREIKEYMIAAAYRESGPTHIVTVTEYLVNLVKKDMKEQKAHCAECPFNF